MVGVLALVPTLAYGHHGPTTVTINAAAKKQAPVPFSHEKHAEKLVKSCDTCHHMNKGLKAGGDVSKVQKCSTCHLDPKDPKTPGMREMSMAKNPFHMVCVDCHKSGKKGPSTCTGCHVKK